MNSKPREKKFSSFFIVLLVGFCQLLSLLSLSCAWADDGEPRPSRRAFLIGAAQAGVLAVAPQGIYEASSTTLAMDGRTFLMGCNSLGIRDMIPLVLELLAETVGNLSLTPNSCALLRGVEQDRAFSRRQIFQGALADAAGHIERKLLVHDQTKLGHEWQRAEFLSRRGLVSGMARLVDKDAADRLSKALSEEPAFALDSRKIEEVIRGQKNSQCEPYLTPKQIAEVYFIQEE